MQEPVVSWLHEACRHHAEVHIREAHDTTCRCVFESLACLSIIQALHRHRVYVYVSIP